MVLHGPKSCWLENYCDHNVHVICKNVTENILDDTTSAVEKDDLLFPRVRGGLGQHKPLVGRTTGIRQQLLWVKAHG